MRRILARSKSARTSRRKNLTGLPGLQGERHRHECNQSKDLRQGAKGACFPPSSTSLGSMYLMTVDETRLRPRSGAFSRKILVGPLAVLFSYMLYVHCMYYRCRLYSVTLLDFCECVQNQGEQMECEKSSGF